jgi:hypothetical protein
MVSTILILYGSAYGKFIIQYLSFINKHIFKANAFLEKAEGKKRLVIPVFNIKVYAGCQYG